MRVPDYPAPSRALTGEEKILGIQDGETVAIPANMIAGSAVPVADALAGGEELLLLQAGQTKRSPLGDAVRSSVPGIDQFIVTTETIGRPLIGGGIAGAAGGVWIDNQPTTAPMTITSASAYIDAAGSGAGSFVWFSPDGSNWKLENMVAATGITGAGVHAQSIAPFTLPTGSVVGWYTPAGGALIDVKTSGGANLNQVPLTPSVGNSYPLVSNPFVVAVSMTGHTVGVGDRLLAVETGLGNLEAAATPDSGIADRITAATAHVAALTATIAGTLNRDGADTAIAGSVTVAAPSGTNVRYDVVFIDLGTLTIGSLAGTARATNADAAEFIPAVSSSSQLALFNLRVQSGAMTAIPVWNLDDGEPRALAAAIGRDRVAGRRRIPKTLRKISRLAALKVAFLGDSITAQQNSPPDKTTPNGVNRDHGQTSGNYLDSGILGADLIAAQPLFTSVAMGHTDDGIGQNHTMFGYHWEAARALVAAGYTLGAGGLTIDNWGYAGAASSDIVSGSAATAWLAAVIASAPDACVVAFGMNEYGSGATEANMVAALTLLKNAGIERIVMGVARKNSSQDISGWQMTQRALRRAADYTGSAFVDPSCIYDDAYLGAIGMTASDICGCNHINHPGIREHAVIGRLLSRLLLG